MNEIEAIIIAAIKEILGIEIDNLHLNLFDPCCHIKSYELIYVFERLEVRLQKPVFKLFEMNDPGIFTIEKLAKAIVAL